MSDTKRMCPFPVALYVALIVSLGLNVLLGIAVAMHNVMLANARGETLKAQAELEGVQAQWAKEKEHCQAQNGQLASCLITLGRYQQVLHQTTEKFDAAPQTPEIQQVLMVLKALKLLL